MSHAETFVVRRGLGIIALLLMALITGCTLPGAGVAVDEAQPVFSGAPTVTIVSPLNMARYLAGVNVNLLAAVGNAGADIDRVEVSVDGVVIATIPTPNPSGEASFSITQTWPAGEAGEHTLSVVAVRESGESSAPASVTVEVLAELPSVATSTPTTPPTTPTPTLPLVSATPTTPTATQTPAASNTPEASATLSAPRVVSRGVNVRTGPSTNFVPPLGVLAVGETADIVALNTQGDWLKIRFASSVGEFGWVFRNIVDVEGNLDSLPREAGPPIPTLAPPTATTAPVVQPTATSGGGGGGTTGGANLIIENFVLSPRDPFCNQPAQAQINIGNIGDQPTATGGFISFATENTDGSNRQVLNTVEIPVLAAGQRNFLVLIDFRDTNVANRGDGIKRSLVILDANNQIPETNNADNTATGEFALGVPCQ